jgi:hypothetical protein
MSKQVVHGVLAFIAVCGMGLVTSSAAGIAWGTGDAGATALMTFFFASMAFAFVGFFPRGM